MTEPTFHHDPVLLGRVLELLRRGARRHDRRRHPWRCRPRGDRCSRPEPISGSSGSTRIRTPWPRRRPGSPRTATGPRLSLPASTSWPRSSPRPAPPSNRSSGPVRPRRRSSAARPTPNGASPTATTPRSTCGWTTSADRSAADVVNGYDEADLAADPAPLRRRAVRHPHRPRHRRRPTRAHHRAAGRARRAGPSPRRPAAGRSSGEAVVPGDADRGQPGARRAARRRSTPRCRRARPRRTPAGHQLPLRRGPHRQGPLPPGRDRWLRLPARPAVRAAAPARGPAPQAGRLDRRTPTRSAANPRAASARLRAVEKLPPADADAASGAP